MNRGGQTYFYQLNGHGDVVALTDATTGTVVNTYDYDAFGNVVKQTGTVVNPYLYAGYRYDKETRLYYLQARYYKPDTGRFLTLDPSAGDTKIPLTQNGYIYGDNNPTMKIDSDGNIGRLIWRGLSETVLPIAFYRFVWHAAKYYHKTYRHKSLRLYYSFRRAAWEDGISILPIPGYLQTRIKKYGPKLRRKEKSLINRTARYLHDSGRSALYRADLPEQSYF